MMNINRNNYESYFIDYIDGTLTSEEVKKLYAFLLLNDDLNDDLNELLECQSEVKLQAPNIEYGQKHILKKDKLHECTDYYAIATVENSLTTHDKEFLRKHPVSKEDIAAYQKVYLNSDIHINYPNKAKLYHHSKLYLTTIQRYISAAIIVLLVGISYLFYPQQTARIELSLAQAIVIPSTELITPKQVIISLKTKVQATPSSTTIKQERIDLSLMDLSLIELNNSSMVELSAIELSSAEPDYSLIIEDRFRVSIKPPEMYLTEAAHTWKGDGVPFLSDNIIVSMRDRGKIITQRLKIKYLTNNNRNDYALH